MYLLRDSKNFLLLPSLISPRLLIQIEWFLIPWIDLWVIFLKPPLISHLNSSSNLINFQKISWKYLNSLWIRPLFTIIPFNSWLIPNIGKLGFISDTRPCAIDDLTISSHQNLICWGLSDGSQSSNYVHQLMLNKKIITTNHFLTDWLWYQYNLSLEDQEWPYL